MIRVDAKRIIFGIAWLLMSSSVVARGASAQSDEESAVRSVMEAVSQATMDGDFDSLDTLYASDDWVHIIEGSGVNHGWADYRDHHLKPEFEEFENFQYRQFAVEPQVRGDFAWTPFRYEFSVDTPRGHVEIEGRGTAVLEKRGGRWVIVHRHTSGRRK